MESQKEKEVRNMTYSEIRARARNNLQGSWGLSIAVAAVACLLGGLVWGSAFLPDASFTIPIPFLQRLNEKLNAGIQWGTVTFSFKGGILGALAFFLGGTVELGYVRFLLDQHDGRELRFETLFSQFYRLGQGFVLHLLRGVYILCWSLLFIIPGIVKTYSYAMASFLMAEDPDLSPNDAITLSRRLMDGHKGELFILDLTFIGWSLLAALTLNLGNLALNPYKSAARTVFYRELVGKNRVTVE